MQNKTVKYIILVGDGMGDHPIAELNNQTVLAAVNTPAMDYLAGHGELCLLKTVPTGLPPGSDIANLSLLGYKPEKYYTGRAPLEAASMGIKLSQDQIAFRCNLVTLNFKSQEQIIMEDYSGGHIATDDAAVLIKNLAQIFNSDCIHLYPGVSYRHLLLYKGETGNLVTVPPHDHIGQNVNKYWQRYQKVPHFKSLLSKGCDLLAAHQINAERQADGKKPANAIWLWGEGKTPSLPTLWQQYGISGALLSAVDLLKGIGVYAGLEIINVPGTTGWIDTNYEGEASAALAALKTHDLVFVHVEAPDEAGHQGLLAEKMQAIDDFDRKIVTPIFKGLQKEKFDYRLVVAMDHFTPLALRTHTDQPVPIVIYDSREQRNDSGLHYNEEDALKTDIMIQDGEQFMKKILERQGDG